MRDDGNGGDGGIGSGRRHAPRHRPPSISELIDARLSRRQALKALAAAAVTTAGPPLAAALDARPARAAAGLSTLSFPELAHGQSESHAVAAGYEAMTLIRWGDPLEPGAPAFDPLKQTAAAQAKQWGYNNDYIAYLPLPMGSASPDHGLLCANFEYTIAHLMFPGLKAGDLSGITGEQCDIEMAAHGHGIVEIRRDDTGRWAVVAESPYNRRITALASECRIAGPAAGHVRLTTSADPTGTKVVGTLNNCAGGKTPWHTVLIAEENFNYYFGGDPAKTASAEQLRKYGIAGKPEYAWFRYQDRFDVEKEPNEPNRFGWIVEIDPYDPQSVPVKRTALGRFKHEGATTVLDGDGRVVVYCGDDERFQYVYKFVTAGKVDPGNPAGSRDLLDYGTLYVAKFHDDGTLAWLPLVFGTGPLTGDNGFSSQADILIETRRAADLLGATPMDRPEDIETNPKTGLVYVVLTNNSKREPAMADAANPRAPNPHGHILELSPAGDRRCSRSRGDRIQLGRLPPRRQPDEGGGRGPLSSGRERRRLAVVARQHRLRPAGTDLDRDRRGAEVRHRRRRLCQRYGRTRTGDDPPFLPNADRRRTVRAGIQCRRHSLFRRSAAPGRERRLDLRRAIHPLAGLSAGHTATTVRAGYRQDGWRHHRILTPIGVNGALAM